MGQSASKSLFDEPKPTWHEVPNSKTSTHGAARLVDLPTKYKPYMTLYTNLMERRAVDDGSRRIFGWRTRDEAANTVGDYEWVTYSQFLDHVATVSAAMAHDLGLKRQEPVGLFCKNRYEWVQVEHAANRMAYQLVPLYDTLGPTAVPFIINQTEMRVLFVAKQQFPTLLRALDQCTSIKIVVQFEPVTEEQKQQASAKGVELKDWTGLLEAAKSKPVDADPPNPEDVATICYTSGTTGDPKGVMLTHANMISAAHGATALEAILLDDVHLSYLPLPHVFERAVQAGTICAGGCVGFYQGDVSKLTDDMAALQPTIFPGVPRVLNRIHDKITQGVEKAGGVKKMLFDRAYAAKKYWLAQGYVTHAFWDAVIFKKVQQLMGGRVRIIMNGSAPIAQDCKEFLQIVFGVPVIEGYGMTENAAVTALSTRAFAPGTHVGMPIPQLEVCLFDVPEMNYTSADSPEPRGEICVRGPGVFKGYFKDPVKTAETIDAEGWLHTGDIGKWNADGTLSIIDRKKNIFKLSQGEYVAPEKIENVYLKSTLVAQIFVHGNSLQNYLVGIVIPEKESVLEWAKKNGHEQDLKALYASDELKKAINADLEELAVKYGLFRFERVHKLHLHDEVWTADNNLATPTFKLKRPQLVEYYANAIEDMYAA